MRLLSLVLLLVVTLSFAIWVQPYLHPVAMEYQGLMPAQSTHHAP